MVGESPLRFVKQTAIVQLVRNAALTSPVTLLNGYSKKMLCKIPSPILTCISVLKTLGTS